MGEVYRAVDPRMGRPVAIKVLPKALSSDPERLQRFEQEARAAGLLNHNNLLTIYELGSHEGAPYIVSELLEGETLRERMQKGLIPLRKAIEYAIQIARGLSAAHEKGVVHRDIKPENLFITIDGRVKILDFGLAKLAASEVGLTDAHTAQRNTTPGTVLGTIGYMSPEQIRAGVIDSRSDIFSLGTVMFEMLSGAHPFQRDTSAETMTAILREDPPEVSVTGAHLSPALDRVVRHCLEKTPNERFHSARDLIFDLESVSGSSAPHASGVVAALPKERKPAVWIGGVALAAAAALAAAFFAGRITGGGGAHAPATHSSFQQITYLPGVETTPSISPDGRSILFVSRKEGKEDIYLQRIDGRNAINLTKDLAGDHAQPAFSPDGNQIAFHSSRDGGGIFLMGATGESVKRLTSFGADPSWSPDGKTIVFGTERFFTPYVRQSVSALWSVEVGSGKTTLLLKQDGVQPRISPNGKQIAYWGLPFGSGDREIWTIPLAGDPDGKNAVRVTSDAHLDWNPFWSADGKWLYFASDRYGSMNLWRMGIDQDSGQASGEPERVMLPARWSGHFSPSPDGMKIAFASLTQSSRIEEWSIEAPDTPPRVILGGSLLPTSVAASPDGRMLAFTAAAPQEDLYVINTDGTGLRQLTSDAEKDRGVSWSPDGTQITFHSSRNGRYEIWSIRLDGSDLRQLTSTTGDTVTVPKWSADGRRLLADHGGLWLFDLDTTPAAGKLVTIKDLPDGSRFRIGDWFRDGKAVAGELWRESLAMPGVLLLDLDSGTMQRLTDFGGSPHFLPDGRALTMIHDERMLLLDRTTGETRSLFDIAPSTIWNTGNSPQKQYRSTAYYSLSPDGRFAYLIRTEIESDIWLASMPGAQPGQ